MDDIFEIYEPVYRDGISIIPILVTIFLVAGLIISAVLIYKKLKNRVKLLTPEKIYKNFLDEVLTIQNEMGKSDSHQFSQRVTFIIKKFLTDFYHTDFLHTTNSEMIEKLHGLTNRDLNGLKISFIEKLEVSQYGKMSLNNMEKDEILKSSAETITNIYNELKEKESV